MLTRLHFEHNFQVFQSPKQFRYNTFTSIQTNILDSQPRNMDFWVNFHCEESFFGETEGSVLSRILIFFKLLKKLHTTQ
jgi:hypothetical protein